MSPVSTDPRRIDWFLEHAVAQVLPTRDVLRARMLKGERLRVYLGIDPTGPSVHLGHALSVQKLAELQAMGHEVILLMGDFTAMIGDPTDKGAARVRLTREQVLENLRNYKQQLSKILRFDGENPAQIRFNSEWLAKMSFADVVELASHFTVQQMMERDMFEKRLEEEKPIYLHEFFYPLMQGKDSVALDVDLEIGGNDQLFNMLAGRTLSRELNKKDKAVMTCKLLTDANGKKMGKTEGNMVALSDSPQDAYGKIMSWPDEMIMPGFEILTCLTGDLKDEEIAIEERMARLSKENPMTLKKELAHRIVAWAYDNAEETTQADAAALAFSSVHQEGALPQEIQQVQVPAGTLSLVEALVLAKFVSSNSEARRQIEQGAVKVSGEVVKDLKAQLMISEEPVVIQKGKLHIACLSSKSLV